MISSSAVYCAQVEPDADVVSLRYTLVYLDDCGQLSAMRLLPAIAPADPASRRDR